MLELALAFFSLAVGSFRIAGFPATSDPAPQLPPADS